MNYVFLINSDDMELMWGMFGINRLLLQSQWHRGMTRCMTKHINNTVATITIKILLKVA